MRRPLSEADPVVSGEGSIDPLGLAAIADSLATCLVPGVRERQRHPRGLTAMAVSFWVCRDFAEDMVAADRVSEPWQVFEWYVVEGLVRRTENAGDLDGLPGRDKAKRALADRVPLSAARYLKNPSITGIHGVYRQLARSVGVEEGGRLGGFGYQLLEAWAADRGLAGFLGSTGGPGRKLLEKLREAIRDGLAAAATARSGGWDGWQFFVDHLSLRQAKGRERKLLIYALKQPGVGFRQAVLEYLVSPVGRAIIDADDAISERRVHEGLARDCDAQMRPLIRAILAYEEFARLLTNAFYACLHAMTRSRRPIPTTALASIPCVLRAAEQGPMMFERLIDLLSPFGESTRFSQAFNALADRSAPTDWVDDFLEHHQKVQRMKPPGGKAPWFERLDSGACMIRAAYRQDDVDLDNTEYVHGYRTVPLWSFAEDLRML